MDFSTLNSILPLEMINKIMFEHKGLTHPTAIMIKQLITDYEYMDGDYKTLDQKNEEEDDDDQIINTVVNIYDTENRTNAPYYSLNSNDELIIIKGYEKIEIFEKKIKNFCNSSTF